MNIREAFMNQGLYMGHMMSHSKSLYRENNPHSVCYFNANIVTLNEGKIWWGDLDLTKHGEALKAIADEIGEVIYVLRESDGRFENEGVDGLLLLTKAVWDTTQEIPFQ